MTKTTSRWVPGLLTLFAAAMALAVLWFVAARSGWLTPSDAELRARYGLANSKYLTLDGEPIHYVDEGQGAAIVLIHGSFGSLRMWNSWAQPLRQRYRVIRLDRPPMGLSGPDPSGRYDYDREIQLVGELTAALGVKQFYLVATSSAGVSGAAFAAEHPDRIKGLVLANIAVGPVRMDVEHLSAPFKRILKIDRWFNGWHLQEFWRQVLLANFYDASKVTPDLVREWTDLNNRAQRMPAAPGSPKPTAGFARTLTDLPRITAPTLLLWSADDHEVPVATVGQAALKLLASQDKSLQVLPRCGHMMPLECGPESVALAAAFIGRVEGAAH
jgi:pimeloyl-ACP methyl ester carboxylesterase